MRTATGTMDVSDNMYGWRANLPCFLVPHPLTDVKMVTKAMADERARQEGRSMMVLAAVCRGYVGHAPRSLFALLAIDAEHYDLTDFVQSE